MQDGCHHYLVHDLLQGRFAGPRYAPLVADYTAHPRCIVLSTHLIDEAAELLERILIIDRELADHLALRLDRLTLQQLAIYAAGSHDRLDLTERETAR